MKDFNFPRSHLFILCPHVVMISSPHLDNEEIFRSCWSPEIWINYKFQFFFVFLKYQKKLILID